jgi:hypothetical protein
MWCCWICPNHDLGDAAWEFASDYGEDDGLSGCNPHAQSAAFRRPALSGAAPD